MKKNIMFFSPLVHVAVMIYILFGFSTLSAGDQFANYLFPEDQYFENVAAISLFLTSFMFFYAFLLTLRLQSRDVFFRMKLMALLGLALIAFFGAGEEISWGQRIFNIQTPEALARVNVQEEITVHNIEINGYSIPFETLFDLFWLTFTIIIPLAGIYNKPFRQFGNKLFFILPLDIGFLFLFNYLWAKAAEAIYVSGYSFDRVPFVQAVQEIKESNYEALFVFAALYVIQDLKLGRNTSNKA